MPEKLQNCSPKCVAEKLKTLTIAQDAKVHLSKSRRTKEESYLQDLKAKRPIAWGLLKDERWSALDNAVASRGAVA